jgi:NADPH:quinone reductase-like Zn-dependent oxidoreductase
MLDDMARAVDANRIRAVIGATSAFEDVPAAFEFAAKSGHAGKVLIKYA